MTDYAFPTTTLFARQATTTPSIITYPSIPAITSFPFNPLTTTFTPPPICNGLYNSFPQVAMIDPFTTCLPPSFTGAASAYYSPGIQCPSGYSTACHDNTGVASITTVTCCPFRQGISLSCVPTPQSLAGAFETLFCTWAASTQTSILMTLSEEGRTSTALVAHQAPGGFNARGVRMVYEESDLASPGITGTESRSATASPSASSTQNTSAAIIPGQASPASGASQAAMSGGMPMGVKIGVAVAVPILVIILAVASFLLWRRRGKRMSEGSEKQEPGFVQQLDSNPVHEMHHQEPHDRKEYRFGNWRSSQRPAELQ